MLWKYAQYASKFGKLISGHRTWKGQFSFSSQRKAMPKNVQTTTQLHSSHMLAEYCSKFSKLGFNSTWIENFQMFKLDLEKAKEPEINFQYLLDPRKNKRIALLLHWLRHFDCVDHNKLQKILKEMGILDHLTCLLRNLCAGQEATIRTRHRTTDQFQIGKGVHQGCILSPCLFNLHAEYIVQNARLDEAQAWIKIARRSISNLR